MLINWSNLNRGCTLLKNDRGKNNMSVENANLRA